MATSTIKNGYEVNNSIELASAFSVYNNRKFVKKSGRVVYVELSFTVNSNQSSGTKLTTLPYGFRPAYTFRFTGVSEGGTVRLFQLSSTGELTLQNNVATNEIYNIYVTFIQ